jgi:hypothetical protein
VTASPRGVRVDVRLTDGTGFRRHFSGFPSATAWMRSPEFLDTADSVRSVHLGTRGEFPPASATAWIDNMARKAAAAERELRALGGLPPLPRPERTRQ